MSKAYQLKVMHVASGDLWAGAEVQLFTLVKALHARSDTAISVVLLNYGRLEQELKSASINVIVLDESKLNGFQILRQLTRIIQEQNPDVVHTHRLKENILGSIAAFISGKTASLRTAHGAPEHRPPWWKLPKRMLYLLDRLCGRHLQDKIVAVSSDLASILEKNIPAAQIRVIENGIDLATIHRDYPSFAPQINSQRTFKVGLAGRLVAVKRVDIFIQTARHLMVEYPDLDASFHIYGDGPMRRELENLCQASGTNNIVHFEGHCDNLLKELQQLDVLLMTSDHEGLPMVLLEAMALETPIIAHATGGIPQLLDRGTSGILVHEQNGAVYAKEIDKLLNSPESRLKITSNALQHVTENNSDIQNANAYHDLYSEIASPMNPVVHR